MPQDLSSERDLSNPLPELRLETDVAALIREADHRVANSLASIAGFVRLQASEAGRRQRALDPREVQLLLSDVSLRIDAQGRLHRLLSRQGGDHTVDLGVHLTEVAGIVAASFGGVKIVNRCERGCIVTAVQAGSIALIVSELITNAAKYAHPSGIPVEITLDCRRDEEGRIRVGVADDGVGLPEDFDPTVDGGLGMRVTRGLAIQLGAEFKIATSMLGVRAILTLPS